MKKFLFSAMFSAFALMAFDAAATPLPTPIIGPATIDWTVHQQKLNSVPEYTGNGKTNVAGTGKSKATNVVQIYNSSFTTTTLDNAGILDLLENSLNTTFPAGTKLVTDGADLFVVDHTGTNEIADISSIVTVTTTNAVTLGSDKTTQTSNESGTSNAASGAVSGDQGVIVNYDDSGLTTHDGTTTTFMFLGVSVFSETGSSTTSPASLTTEVVKGTESGKFTVTGTGYGNIRGQASLIQGTIMGTPAGTYTYTE